MWQFTSWWRPIGDITFLPDISSGHLQNRKDTPTKEDVFKLEPTSIIKTSFVNSEEGVAHQWLTEDPRKSGHQRRGERLP